METTQEIKEDALNFLTAHTVATLATISPAHKPHAATIYAHVEPDFCFYFIVKTKTSKYENMQQEPHVAIVVTDESAVTTVQAEGRVEFITNQEKITRIRESIAKLAQKNTPWPPPVDQMKEGEYVVCKITPFWLRYANFKNQPSTDTQHYQHFHQIIP